jgi:GTP-binding protein
VIADIPGLIEGASAGAGLGHDFLAHVERTRLLVHVLDARPLDGSDPVENHAVVERELEQHDPRLASLPRVLALSKADLLDPESADAARVEWERRLGGEVPVLLTSSVTRQGLDALARVLMQRIPVSTRDSAGVVDPASAPLEPLAEHRVFRPVAPRAFDVERVGERSFRVSGAGVERLVARYDLGNEEAMAHLERRLRGAGVIRALEAHGFEAGDDVEIAGVEFELDPEP